MATTTAPTTAASVAPQSGYERLARQVGGQDHLRILLARLADAIDQGGTTWLILDGPPAEVRSHRLLKGGPLW